VGIDGDDSHLKWSSLLRDRKKQNEADAKSRALLGPAPHFTLARPLPTNCSTQGWLGGVCKNWSRRHMTWRLLTLQISATNTLPRVLFSSASEPQLHEQLQRSSLHESTMGTPVASHLDELALQTKIDDYGDTL
jgi:hypothetical protein